MTQRERIELFLDTPRSLAQIAWHCHVWPREAFNILAKLVSEGRVKVTVIDINGRNLRGYVQNENETTASEPDPELRGQAARHNGIGHSQPQPSG